MKVLQLIPNSNFYGAERVVYSLSKGLQSAGVDVIIVTSRTLLEKFKEIRPSSIYVLPNHEGNVIRRAHAILREVSCLRQIISKEHPDIIHVHGSLARLLMLATDTNQLVVETLHGVGLTKRETLHRLTQKVSDFLAAISFDGSVFYTGGTICNYSRLRLLRPNAVIHNAVDVDFVKLISRTNESPIDGEYILWCGRLDAVKGTDLLLRAFARLEKPDTELILLGDGPQRGYLQSLAESLDIHERTVFVGYVDGAEKARFFQHASAVCVDLISPGVSQSLVEAIFSGNPVIARYDSEVEEIFGENVALIGEPSVSKLATILSDTLKRKQRRNQPFTLDISLEKRFSLEYFTEQYLAFYSRVK